MVYTILPYIGIGDLKLNADREEVRNFFDNKYNEFRKSETSENTTDDFEFCHAYYDREDKLKAVEFFNDENVDIIYNDESLLKISYTRLKEILKNSKLEIEDCGFTDYYNGIAGYTSSNDENESVETILIFRKGYYD